jgi:hypothetical protein
MSKMRNRPAPGVVEPRNGDRYRTTAWWFATLKAGQSKNIANFHQR